MGNLKNKRGFTLIELLAVIVILSIILVIAVPQVLKVINQAKKDSLAASAKMYASALETDYLTSQTSDDPQTPSATFKACTAGIVDFANGTCTYSLTVTNDIPTATVNILGDGKFASLVVCGATKSDATATDGTTCP